MQTAGKFITFEGIDGSGKTTQLQTVVAHLRKKQDVMVLREPGGTVISERIRDVLLASSSTGMTAAGELLLFSAARAQIVREKIIPALSAGIWVVCDRFYDSTMAYQGYGRGLDKDFINDLNEFAIAGCKPDLTIYLDISTEEAALRLQQRVGKKDRLDAESEAFMKKVRLGYLAIGESEPDRFLVVDGSGRVDEVTDEIMEHLRRIES